MIEVTASDGHKFSAYRADPPGEAKGAVVVIQDVFGVNASIRKMADRFAAEGYVAIAPSLFDRVKPSVELGHDDAGRTEGTELAKQIDLEAALADIAAAAETVKSAGKVAVVGFGQGGYLAYVSANGVPGLACAVGYYGMGIIDQIQPKRLIPTLLHFGEADELISFEEVGHFRFNRPDVSSFSYPDAAHGFACEEQSGYNADAAASAMERTLFFISQFVVGQEPILLKNSGSYAQAKVDKKKKKTEGGDDLGPPPA